MQIYRFGSHLFLYDVDAINVNNLQCSNSIELMPV